MQYKAAMNNVRNTHTFLERGWRLGGAISSRPVLDAGVAVEAASLVDPDTLPFDPNSLSSTSPTSLSSAGSGVGGGAVAVVGASTALVLTRAPNRPFPRVSGIMTRRLGIANDEGRLGGPCWGGSGLSSMFCAKAISSRGSKTQSGSATFKSLGVCGATEATGVAILSTTQGVVN